MTDMTITIFRFWLTIPILYVNDSIYTKFYVHCGDGWKINVQKITIGKSRIRVLKSTTLIYILCFSVYFSADKTWWGRQSACTPSGIQIWPESWACAVPTSLCASYRNIANMVTCRVSWRSKLRNPRKLIRQSSKDIDTQFNTPHPTNSAIYVLVHQREIIFSKQWRKLTYVDRINILCWCNVIVLCR